MRRATIDNLCADEALIWAGSYPRGEVEAIDANSSEHMLPLTLDYASPGSIEVISTRACVVQATRRRLWMECRHEHAPARRRHGDHRLCC